MGLKIILLLCVTGVALADDEYFSTSGGMFNYNLVEHAHDLEDELGDTDDEDYDSKPHVVGSKGLGAGHGPNKHSFPGQGHGPPKPPSFPGQGHGAAARHLFPGYPTGPVYHRPRRVLQRCRTAITPYGSTCSSGFLFGSSKKCASQKCYHKTSIGYTVCDHHPVYLYKPYGKKTIQCRNDYQQCQSGLLRKCYCRTVWCKRKVKKVVKVLSKYRQMYVYVTYPCKCQCRRKD